MNLSNITNKMSGLKLPSKIKRPTSIPIQKYSALTENDHNGVNSTVKKLNDELTKVKLSDDSNDDTIRISPEITSRKKNDSISSWDGDRKHGGENGTRRSSDASIVLTEDTDSFIVGDRVWVGGTKPGVIAFIGETQFGPGDWAGIVLDEPIGKNDGSVAGKRYFQCEQNRGIFSRLTRLSQMRLDYTPVTPRSNGTPITSTPNHNTFPVTSSSSLSSKTPTGSSTGSVDLKIGDRVIVQSSQGSKPGILRYCGRTEFGTGLWCGVELDDPLGKNDGSVDGVRYFECASKFGLFVPAEKVSRSPVNNKKSSCIVHPGGISRQGTQESIRSVSTIGTVASSVKSNARVRLGVNSLVQRPSRLSAVRSTPPVVPKSPLQNELKEKEAYIKQLLKEKEMERGALTRAASQAEEFEKKLTVLQDQYNRLSNEKEVQNETMMCAINKLEKEKLKLTHQLDEERRKAEDLQFSFEEESLTKSEIQVLNDQYKAKLETLEQSKNRKSYENGEKVESELRGNERKIISSSDNYGETVELRRRLAELQDEFDNYKSSNEERSRLSEIRSFNIASALERKDYLLEKAETTNRKMEERLNQSEEDKLKSKKELDELLDSERKLFDSRLNYLSTYLKRLCAELDVKNRLLAECMNGKRKIEHIDELRRRRLDYDDKNVDCITDAKETLTDLTNKIDFLLDANVTLLDKIGTLSDVIDRKDDELSQLSTEREQLSKEYSDLTVWKSSMIDRNFEAKYYDLLATKEDLENQLRISSDNIRKLENLFSGKDESSKLEIENMKSILNDKISDYECLFVDFNDKINHLSREIQRKDEETTDSLGKQCETIRRLNAELKETVPDLEKTRRAKEQLESDVKAKESEIDNLKEICADLKDKLKELESLFNKDADRSNRHDDYNGNRNNDDKSSIIDNKIEFKQSEYNALKNNYVKLIEFLNRIVYNDGDEEYDEGYGSRTRLIGDELDANTIDLIVKIRQTFNSWKNVKNQLREREIELSDDYQQRMKSCNDEKFVADIPPSRDKEFVHKAEEEKSQSAYEIKFLNSVIVGMHQKNQDLLDRINYLETRIENEVPKNTTRTKMITPRLFCDICDMFDLHDTDDCSQQSDSAASKAVANNGERKKVPERTYCDVCEMFGHDTTECDDNVTF